MIIPSRLKGQKIAVIGLGRTGLAALEALRAAGAFVTGYDDDPAKHALAGRDFRDLKQLGLAGFDGILLAPGIPFLHPKPHWIASEAARLSIPLLSDFDLFEAARADLPPHKLVAITGTNGKSTTSALIHHILKSAGIKTALGGNIGTGVLALEPLEAGGIYVIEASSYQIDLTKNFTPDVAILLNITPDHLERHGGMAGYIAAKEKLFYLQEKISLQNKALLHNMAMPRAIAILGDSDEDCRLLTEKMIKRRQGEPDWALSVFTISTDKAPNRGVFVENGLIYDGMQGFADPRRLCGDLKETPVLNGKHNDQNVAAAFAACRALGLEASTIWRGVKSFPGLVHRQEPVGQLGLVRFINDSKATNVDAAWRALSSFDAIHWIVGGRAKGEALDPLYPYLNRVKKAYLIGESSAVFAKALAGRVPLMACGDLETAFGAALRDAFAPAPNDVSDKTSPTAQNTKAAIGDAPSKAIVLLSPAAAAFDQFPNFEVRGDAFRALAQRFIGEASALSAPPQKEKK